MITRDGFEDIRAAAKDAATKTQNRKSLKKGDIEGKLDYIISLLE